MSNPLAAHLIASPGISHLAIGQIRKPSHASAGMAELQEPAAVPLRDLGEGPGILAKPDPGPGICWVATGRPGQAAEAAAPHTCSWHLEAQVRPWS